MICMKIILKLPGLWFWFGVSEAAKEGLEFALQERWRATDLPKYTVFHIQKSKSDPKSIACLTGFSALWNIHRHLKTTPICRFVTFSVCTFYQHHHPVDGPGLIHPCKKNRCSFSSIAPQLETGKQTQTSEMVSNVCTCSKGVERQGGGRRKVNKCLKNSFNVEEHYF